MPAAVSKDLTWRIVKKRLFYNDTFTCIAQDLDLSRSTVWSVFTRVMHRGGDLETHQGARVGLPANSKLDRTQRLLLLELILLADPGMHLSEIATEFRSIPHRQLQ